MPGPNENLVKDIVGNHAYPYTTFPAGHRVLLETIPMTFISSFSEVLISSEMKITPHPVFEWRMFK